MSDNILKIIASSPTYMPTQETKQKLRALIKTLSPHAEKISIKSRKSIQFIDQALTWKRSSAQFVAKHLTKIGGKKLWINPIKINSLILM